MNLQMKRLMATFVLFSFVSCSVMSNTCLALDDIQTCHVDNKNDNENDKTSNDEQIVSNIPETEEVKVESNTEHSEAKSDIKGTGKNGFRGWLNHNVDLVLTYVGIKALMELLNRVQTKEVDNYIWNRDIIISKQAMPIYNLLIKSIDTNFRLRMIIKDIDAMEFKDDVNNQGIETIYDDSESKYVVKVKETYKMYFDIDESNKALKINRFERI